MHLYLCFTCPTYLGYVIYHNLGSPPLLFCCSSPSDVGALCVLWVCCVFLLVPSRLSLLFCHSGYLVIDQLQLSGAVAGTLQAGGGWKRCAKLLS